jgi:hypothetical protein
MAECPRCAIVFAGCIGDGHDLQLVLLGGRTGAEVE